MARLKIYTDENVDVRVAEGLRRRGIEAVSVYHEGKTGVSDQAQLAHAGAHGAVIFTHDSDLIEIAMELTIGEKTITGNFRRNASAQVR